MIRNIGRLRFPFAENRENSGGADIFSAEKEVNNWVFDFLKTYLHGLYQGILSNPEIGIDLLHGMTSISHPVIRSVRVSCQFEEGLARVEDGYVYARLKYDGAEYYVSLLRMNQQMRGVIHEIIVSGASPSARRPDVLLDLLINEAVNNSMYRGKVLRVREAPSRADDENPMGLDVEIVKNLENAELSEVFLPEWIKIELRKFMECVARHEEIGEPMRYILSGPPGTAKTRIVRSVAKACEGKATIILASGGDSRINTLFSFANIFRPVVLCLDDMDLIAGGRGGGSKNVLGTFLQKLDGFVQSRLFVLATTNDKGTLDFAASRPGRFDQVIDVGVLEPENYLELVKCRTEDPELLTAFGDAEVLELLKKKRVVGAFLANLVKQALISKKTNGKKGLTSRDLLKIIDRTYKGFYRDPDKTAIGFSGGEDYVEDEEEEPMEN